MLMDNYLDVDDAVDVVVAVDVAVQSILRW